MKRNSFFKNEFLWFYQCNWEQNTVHSGKITKRCKKRLSCEENVTWNMSDELQKNTEDYSDEYSISQVKA